MIGAWVVIDPDWLPRRLSHQYGNLKHSHIETIDLDLTSTRPQNTQNSNLVIDVHELVIELVKIFKSVIIFDSQIKNLNE